MDTQVREMSASAFKTRCLALLDEVQRTGIPIVVTKRGVPVARLMPLEKEGPPSLLGSVRYEREEDLLEPVEDDWSADA